jgi:hypothetical protein
VHHIQCNCADLAAVVYVLLYVTLLLLLLLLQHLQVIDEFMELLPKVGVAAAKRAFDRPQKPPAAPADDKPADSKQ